ncbi:MAG: hypothetical protein WDO13_04160 [Verrucomicrobiota bacterium]
MVEKIRQLLHSVPFIPFKIRTTDGREYLVPTADHAAVRPSGSRVIVFGDDDKDIYLSGLHIVAVEEGAGSVQG